MHTASIDIVVPFYNRADLITLCLKALAKAAGSELRQVIVVDDASRAEERAALDALLGGLVLPVEVATHAANRGFVQAIRTGMDRVEAPHVILLNSDTIPTPGFARDLVSVLLQRPEFKASAPISNASSDLFQYRAHAAMTPGTPAELLPQIARICGAARRDFGNVITPVPYLTGMCLALDTAVFKEQGCFAEDYQHGYFEDLDLCCRLRKAGHLLAIREDCFVYHRGQGSYRLMERTEHGRMMQANFQRFCGRWGHLPEHAELLAHIDRATEQP